jgi:hypothetical protein
MSLSLHEEPSAEDRKEAAGKTKKEDEKKRQLEKSNSRSCREREEMRM